MYPGLVAVLSLVFAGCSASNVSREGDVAPISESWNPQALYLVSAPHSRLHVEVDAVQGCDPSDAALEKLRKFLSSSCAKPDGIEIRRSDVIPVDAARGFLARALARKYITGPGSMDGSPPAFMYVLFYDDALFEKPVPAEGGRSSASISKPRRSKPTNPYTDVTFYPAIYFNARYFNTGYFSRWGKNEGLVHEAGHMLGLASRPCFLCGRH
jgi:hypothetical protein